MHLLHYFFFFFHLDLLSVAIRIFFFSVTSLIQTKDFAVHELSNASLHDFSASEQNPKMYPYFYKHYATLDYHTYGCHELTFSFNDHKYSFNAQTWT